MNQQKLNELRLRRMHVAIVTGRRAKTRRKAPQQRYPSAIAIEQARKLKGFVAEMRAVTKELITPKLPSFVIKQDAVSDELDALIGAVRLVFGQRFSNAKLTSVARTYAENIDKFNAVEMDRVFTTLLNVPVGSVKGLSDHLDAFVKDNVRLIKSIPEKYLDEVEGIINRGSRAGARAEDMAAQIYDRLDVSESRAQLIARDQANKLYGELTKLRQTSIGVSRYTWRTSRDEKVRPSHQAHEGQVYSWDEPPADTGHPGADVRCRCTAEALVDDLLNALDE